MRTLLASDRVVDQRSVVSPLRAVPSSPGVRPRPPRVRQGTAARADARACSIPTGQRVKMLGDSACQEELEQLASELVPGLVRDAVLPAGRLVADQPSSSRCHHRPKFTELPRARRPVARCPPHQSRRSRSLQTRVERTICNLVFAPRDDGKARGFCGPRTRAASQPIRPISREVKRFIGIGADKCSITGHFGCCLAKS